MLKLDEGETQFSNGFTKATQHPRHAQNAWGCPATIKLLMGRGIYSGVIYESSSPVVSCNLLWRGPHGLTARFSFHNCQQPPPAARQYQPPKPSAFSHLPVIHSPSCYCLLSNFYSSLPEHRVA